MPYFTEQGKTHSECLEKIRARYGSGAKVLLERTVRKGGFLGIGAYEEVEMTGTYGYAPAPDLETAKRQVLAAAGKAVPDAALQTVLKEIRSLNEKLDTKISEAPRVQELREHPSLQKLEEDLRINDFSPACIRGILERARKEFPLDDLDNYEDVQKRAVLWIAEQIALYQEPDIRKKPRIIVLVGPTGVGKTTTIAKLAAMYGELSGGQWRHSVRMITLDNYRIGGKHQIEKYGEIMEIPVSTVENYESLRKALALYREKVDFVLVDTIGKSPRNYGELGEMKAILDACPAKTEFQLCIAASTKSSDIKEILRQFEPFKYRAVIVTKLDETTGVGNVISALAEGGKPISFITTGQTVPPDIERASIASLLCNLEGFTVDRQILGNRFGAYLDSLDHLKLKDTGA
ncbi:MAG: flagellar biosynthesis protein FlhF [Spirochaetaceae bacterium]|jgi:flagellar biosynthesis protein FlhF|nr:flagellar biosynthesis protein FlhF [Spirochaetaceae bacterium]